MAWYRYWDGSITMPAEAYEALCASEHARDPRTGAPIPYRSWLDPDPGADVAIRVERAADGAVTLTFGGLCKSLGVQPLMDHVAVLAERHPSMRGDLWTVDEDDDEEGAITLRVADGRVRVLDADGAGIGTIEVSAARAPAVAEVHLPDGAVRWVTWSVPGGPDGGASPAPAPVTLTVALPDRRDGRPLARPVIFALDPLERVWRSIDPLFAARSSASGRVFHRAMRLPPHDPADPASGPLPPDPARGIGFSATIPSVDATRPYRLFGWADQWPATNTDPADADRPLTAVPAGGGSGSPREGSPAVDLGDLCLTCGESTAPGSGRFVNRVSADRDPEDVDARLRRQHPGAPLFIGWWCADCQSADCEACGAEGSGGVIPGTAHRFRASDYIGETGLLCDDHTAVVVCTVCDEAVEDPVTPLVVSPDGWSLRHAGCAPG